MWGLKKYLLWRLANKRQIAVKAKKPVITLDRKNKGRRLDEGEELVYINHGWTRRVKLTMAKEFSCEYSQTQPTFAICNIVIRWATFKTIFVLKEIKTVHVALQNKS